MKELKTQLQTPKLKKAKVPQLSDVQFPTLVVNSKKDMSPREKSNNIFVSPLKVSGLQRYISPKTELGGHGQVREPKPIIQQEHQSINTALSSKNVTTPLGINSQMLSIADKINNKQKAVRFQGLPNKTEMSRG